MERLREIRLEAYDRLISLELSEVAVDCCITKAPCGGEKAGASPVDLKANKASSARLWSMEKASLSGRWQSQPTATTRHCCPKL
jgi:hypothetical protein